MRAPKHLWSGDWRRDSADAAEELSRHRVRVDAAAPGPADAPPPRRSLTDRGVAWLRARRPHRVPAAVVAVLVGLLSAAAAFAAVTVVTGGSGSARAGQARAWLGVETVKLPSASSSLGSGGGGLSPLSGGGGFGFPSGGAVISSVTPGSPAATAGLQPGEVITQIGGRRVGTPQELSTAIAAMHVGQRVAIQFYEGPLAYSAQLTLAARPKQYP
jgi:S1-C subfamily serine protease